MLHGIQEEDWENYLSGEAATAVALRIEAYLIACRACRLLVEQMRQGEQQLARAISAAKQGLVLRDEQVYQGLRGVFLRLLAEESAAEHEQARFIEPWLRALELALADLCGNHAARRVLHAAARSSPARSLDKVETANWQPFLENLTAITQVVCGEPGAQLVGAIGRVPWSADVPSAIN